LKNKLKKEEQDEILNDIDANLEKINHHGKRADSIIKQLQKHHRAGTADKFFEGKKDERSLQLLNA
jgi:hypothetical protein